MYWLPLFKTNEQPLFILMRYLMWKLIALMAKSQIICCVGKLPNCAHPSGHPWVSHGEWEPLIHFLSNGVQWIFCKLKVSITEDSDFFVFWPGFWYSLYPPVLWVPNSPFFSSWGESNLEKHPIPYPFIYEDGEEQCEGAALVSSSIPWFCSALWCLNLSDILWLFPTSQWWKLKTS